jgi:hypothetical protein
MTMKSRPADEPNSRQSHTNLVPPDECERTRVGSWVLPSGNSVDLSVSVDDLGVRHLWWGWDRTPLSSEEAAYYRAVIFPSAMAILGVCRWVAIEL